MWRYRGRKIIKYNWWVGKSYKWKRKIISNLKEKVRKYKKLQFVYIEDESKLAKLYDIGIIDFKRDYP